MTIEGCGTGVSVGTTGACVGAWLGVGELDELGDGLGRELPHFGSFSVPARKISRE